MARSSRYEGIFAFDIDSLMTAVVNLSTVASDGSGGNAQLANRVKAIHCIALFGSTHHNARPALFTLATTHRHRRRRRRAASSRRTCHESLRFPPLDDHKPLVLLTTTMHLDRRIPPVLCRSTDHKADHRLLVGPQVQDRRHLLQMDLSDLKGRV